MFEMHFLNESNYLVMSMKTIKSNSLDNQSPFNDKTKKIITSNKEKHTLAISHFFRTKIKIRKKKYKANTIISKSAIKL